MDHGECDQSASAVESRPVHFTAQTIGAVGSGWIELRHTGCASCSHDLSGGQFCSETANLGLVEMPGKILEFHSIPPEYVNGHNLSASTHIVGQANLRTPHLMFLSLPAELLRNLNRH